jgi:hypothetical protein
VAFFADTNTLSKPLGKISPGFLGLSGTPSKLLPSVSLTVFHGGDWKPDPMQLSLFRVFEAVTG